MRRQIWISALLVLALGCARNEYVLDNVEQEKVTVTATFADSKTRTILSEDGGTSVYWEAGDEIAVFSGTDGSKFTSTLAEPAAVSTFTGTMPAAGGEKYLALYPYSSDAVSDGESITTTLPAEQTARAGSFAKGLNLSIAESDSNSMSFYNVCGGICFKLTTKGIKKITLKSNNGESIAGKVELAFENGIPAVKKVLEGSDTIALTAPDGGTLATGVWYYIVSIPTTLSGGFKMTFRTASESAVLNYSSQLTFKRRIFGRVADIDSGLTWDKKTHEEFKALALDVNHQTTNACGVHSSLSHLYDNATELMNNWNTSPYYEKDADVYVAYTSTINLKDILRIHVNPVSDDGIPDASREDVYTLSELQTKYASLGLDFNFSLVEYTLGSNRTPESAYGIIDGYTFHPAHADFYGKPIMNSGAEKDGISGVGRQPIVHVTLVGSDGDVYLSGYFKIELREDEPLASSVVVHSFEVPYECSIAVQTPWSECSQVAFENELNMSYSRFISRYSNNWNGITYIRKNGEFLGTDYSFSGSKAPSPLPAGKNYGAVRYVPDSTGNDDNDTYKISLNSNQIQNILDDFGSEITLYTLFGTYPADYVMLGITIRIADKPVVMFGEHLRAYWYSTPDNSSSDIIFVNPRIPRGDGTGYDDVTKLSKWINAVWLYNWVKITLDESSKAMYEAIWEVTPVRYHYQFAKTQSCKVALGNGNLVVNAGQDKLYLDAVNGKNLIASIDTHDVHKYVGKVTTDLEGSSLYADDRNYGRITYYHNGSTADCISKQVLNMYEAPGFNGTVALSENLADMLYVDVELVATYGECNVPVGTEQFHVAFFRPIDVKENPAEGFNNVASGSSKVIIGKVFGVTDWKGRDIFIIDASGAYIAKTDICFSDGNNWADYYGITSIRIDIDEVKTNQTGTVKYLKTHGLGEYKTGGIDDDSVLDVRVDADSPHGSLTTVTDGTTGNKSILIDFTGGTPGYEALNDYVLYYSNSAVIQDFELYIPVSVKYWWGEVKGEVTIPVKRAL